MQHHQRVHDVMAEEGAIVSWSDTAEVALERMRGLGCDHLAVIDPNGVVGLCEHSVLLACQHRGGWLGSIAVADLMRRGPFWCHRDDSPDKALAAMERLGTDTLAVLDREKHVVGTVHRHQLLAMPRMRQGSGTEARH